MADWLDTEVKRGVRDRRARCPVPQELPLLAADERKLLQAWVRNDSLNRRRATLMKSADAAGCSIERAEALCDKLQRAGWLQRRERLTGGSWQWESIAWLDLDALKRLLGVGSAQLRAESREALLEEARRWLQARGEVAAAAALDPDHLDELTAALEQLAREATLPLPVLATRVALLYALADWHDAGAQGLRRDFALRARGTTKAIGAADWRWLETFFDLERLRITQFAPMLWLAGAASLHWGERRVDLEALHCAGLPLSDVVRLDRVELAAEAPPRRYWLIENRASFERQAQLREPGCVLLWLPGRPATGWLDAVARLLRLAPAPAWISADADPAGVDIACGVGRLWQAQGLAWEPHRMGLVEWQASTQHWPLNDHDRALLGRLLERPDLEAGLRALCLAMRREGRKAEQEGWL